MTNYEKEFHKKLKIVIGHVINDPVGYSFFINGPTECYISKDGKPVIDEQVSIQDILRSLGMEET